MNTQRLRQLDTYTKFQSLVRHQMHCYLSTVFFYVWDGFFSWSNNLKCWCKKFPSDFPCFTLWLSWALLRQTHTTISRSPVYCMILCYFSQDQTICDKWMLWLPFGRKFLNVHFRGFCCAKIVFCRVGMKNKSLCEKIFYGFQKTRKPLWVRPWVWWLLLK